jgi:hypothetical protein
MDVLQVLQLAQKTGTLAVERINAENVLEQGTITFHNGQMTDASISSFRGNSALHLLLQWSPCYFSFLTSSTQGLAAPPALPPYPPTLNGQSSGKLPALPAWPTQQQQTSPSIPYRLRPIHEVLPHFSALGLSRIHRQLFLLIDGQRPYPELIRLLGRGPDELDSLLADLERSGLIHQ